MFVRQSKYDAMMRRAVEAEVNFTALQSEWNKLVRRINKLGGESFLKNATIQKSPQFTEDELQKMIMLCHPDKHDGKPMATEITQKLLSLKRILPQG